MELREFVISLKEERDALLSSYANATSASAVAEQLRAAGLTPEQSRQVIGALDTALTDAFYTILLILDGAACLNGSQQAFRLLAEDGSVVSEGDGNLEAVAFEVFQVA